MRPNGIAYKNLRAEMGRQNIGIKDLAQACSYNRDTLARKLSMKSPLNLNDAFKIQQTMFPDLDVRYLFATGNEHSST